MDGVQHDEISKSIDHNCIRLFLWFYLG